MKLIYYFALLLFSLLLGCSGAQKYPLPTPEQLQWAQMEVGAMISFGMETMALNLTDNFQNFNTEWWPDVSIFNPMFLNTDDWMEAAASFGAKYAVFTAKHVTGMTLWPTKVPGYTYSIQNTPYLNGTGDIVRDFVNSCNKYNIKPGIYYGCGWNAYMNVRNGVLNTTFYGHPGKQHKATQDEYWEIVNAQLQELWTQYGEFTEIWFDGGVYSNNDDVLALLNKFQPQAVTFQGPEGFKNRLRWVGSEWADMTYPIWSTCDEQGTYGQGEANGTLWAPAESDTTLLNGDNWFYNNNYFEYGPKSIGLLMYEYEHSVGQNSNFLLGLNPDPFGKIPAADSYQYAKLGAALQKCYGKPIVSTDGDGYNITLGNPDKAAINRIVLQEDQTYGQRVRQYTLWGGQNTNSLIHLSNGTSIGNKRIEVLKTEVHYNILVLSIDQAIDYPYILNFAGYNCDNLY